MRLNKAQIFKQLHSNIKPLILINIWDPASAVIMQRAGAPALATSSASLAWANGYSDGGKMPMNLLLLAIQRILRVCTVPLTVDIEDGFSDLPEEVAAFAVELVQMGVAGINIEDGCGPPELLSNKISSIRNLLGSDALFINARTDVYLQELVAPTNMVNESIARSERYISAGADGIFVPAVTLTENVSALSMAIQSPLNVMIPANSTKLKEMSESGVSRISLGPASFLDTYSKLIEINASLLEVEDVHQLNYNNMNDFFK